MKQKHTVRINEHDLSGFNTPRHTEFELKQAKRAFGDYITNQFEFEREEHEDAVVDYSMVIHTYTENQLEEIADLLRDVHGMVGPLGQSRIGRIARILRS